MGNKEFIPFYVENYRTYTMRDSTSSFVFNRHFLYENHFLVLDNRDELTVLAKKLKHFKNRICILVLRWEIILTEGDYQS